MKSKIQDVEYFFDIYIKINVFLNFYIWKSAAEQVFYSLGIDAGPLISMASFSHYRNNIYRDAVLLVVLYELILLIVKKFCCILLNKYLLLKKLFRDTLTSILCSMVIFSFIGFLATEQDKKITEILSNFNLF